MARYVIGDIQGCLEGLLSLLSKIGYVSGRDDLWFAGDLVNRGPDALGVLKFVSAQPHVRVVLGNHDLHCLALFYSASQRHAKGLASVIESVDAPRLMAWLAEQPLMIHDAGVLMVHAGLYPGWSIAEALGYASEVESVLKSKDQGVFLEKMYGDEPAVWSDDLAGWDRLRFITNACVRMRYINVERHCDFQLTQAPTPDVKPWMPWFEHPQAQWDAETSVAFGHWASLKASINRSNLQALDGGYVWGGQLVAWCPETGERITVQAPHKYA